MGKNGTREGRPKKKKQKRKKKGKRKYITYPFHTSVGNGSIARKEDPRKGSR
jgi:hypothetical protein